VTEISPIDLPKSRKILNFVFIVVSLILSLSSLAFYSLWRASEVTHSIDFSRENQSTTASDLIGVILPTTKPTAPSFIYPPSGDEKSNWQTISTGFTKEIDFEMALPKNLPYTKTTSSFNQTALTYYIFENSVNKQISLNCEKTFVSWKNKSLVNPETSGVNPPCNPTDSALFSISLDTAAEPLTSNATSTVTSANYRNWTLSELTEDGVIGHQYLDSTTQLKGSHVLLRVSLDWPSKEALEKTESLFGYDSKTLLNNLLTQMNFGEHGMYGKPN
jgi:hypothetical protein